MSIGLKNVLNIRIGAVLVILIISAVTFPIFANNIQIKGKTYYVSNLGDDSNDGTSPARAWNTIQRVNEHKLLPGDKVCFEKNGVWREQLIPQSGSERGYITYASYGQGEKPLILGSVNKSSRNNWMEEYHNIWVTSIFEGKDIGNIIFSNEIYCGKKVWNEVDLKEQGDFWYDKKNKVLKLFSDHNPGKLYSNIECAITRHIIDESNKSYVIYDGLHLSYGGAHGIGGGNTHHIKVLNCDLSYIGGGILILKDRTVRYGNGIEFWGNAHDNIVEDCRIWEIYDAGLTNQSHNENTLQMNIYYRRNKIWNCEYSFEFWNKTDNSIAKNIYFENNSCKNAGGGWSHKQRPDVTGWHICSFDSHAKNQNIVIKNNVFDKAEKSSIYISPRWNKLSSLTLQNNTYKQPEDKLFAIWQDKIYFAKEFKYFKGKTGKEKNSRLELISPS